jgi:hypothetical protein
MFDQPESPSGAFPEKSSQPVVLILCTDLMFAVQLQNIARKAGFRSITVRPGSDATQGDALVVDMAERSNWEDAIRKARGSGMQVIAFGPHMDAEARRRAKAAGANRVLANSNLERDLPTILRALRDARNETILDENDDAR